MDSSRSVKNVTDRTLRVWTEPNGDEHSLEPGLSLTMSIDEPARFEVEIAEANMGVTSFAENGGMVFHDVSIA